MEKFRWCFIGTGKLAHQVAAQLIGSGRHELVSCYTRNPEHAKAFAEEFHCKACDTAEAAMETDGVEGVYVVTTHNAHFRYVKPALERKLPVLCEKAMTVTAAETDELIRIAREHDTYLCEAMWTWFSPSARKTKEWIDAGAIGDIRSADFTYHMKGINYAPRVSDPRRAGGALLDITVYPITYAYRLWGKPVKIESVGNLQNGIDYGEDVKLTFADGLTVNITTSIVDMKGFEKMKIVGTTGKITATLYHCANGVTLSRGLFRKEKFLGPGPHINSYLDEFDAVAADIRAGRKESELVPLQATSDVMHILDTVRKQIGLHYDDLE